MNKPSSIFLFEKQAEKITNVSENQRMVSESWHSLQHVQCCIEGQVIY